MMAFCLKPLIFWGKVRYFVSHSPLLSFAALPCASKSVTSPRLFVSLSDLGGILQHGDSSLDVKNTSSPVASLPGDWQQPGKIRNRTGQIRNNVWLVLRPAL